MKKRGLNRSGVSDWKLLMAALRRRDTITPAEIAQLVRRYTDVSPDYAQRRLQREGVLQRLDPQRRGLYVVAGEESGAFIADPIEAVQTVCGQGTTFGYGSALFLHGLSRYGRLTEYYVVSSFRRNQQPVGEFVVRYVKTPLPEEAGVITRRRGRLLVRMTDIERTLIDCIHRPKYAQGWENVVQALDRAQRVRADRIIEYVKKYRTPSLVAKIGLVIERYAAKWRVSADELQSLRPYLPATPVRFSRGMGGTLNKEWHLYVPEGLFHA